MLVRGARHSALWRLQASIYLQNKFGSDSKGIFSFLLCSCLSLERITPVRGISLWAPRYQVSFLPAEGLPRTIVWNSALLLPIHFAQSSKLPSSVNDFGFLSAWFNSGWNPLPKAFSSPFICHPKRYLPFIQGSWI